MNFGKMAHRLTEIHECNVVNFGLDNDWDLTEKDQQKLFLDQMDRDEPEEIWIAPMRKLWMPRLTNAKDIAHLAQERLEAEEYMLVFIEKVFNKQTKSGRYAHIIHPKQSMMWNTKPMRGLLGSYKFQLDECKYVQLDKEAQIKPKSPWIVKTNKVEMGYLEAICPRSHNCPLMTETSQLVSNGHEYPHHMMDQICQLLAMEQKNTGDIDDKIPNAELDILLIDDAEDGEPFAGYSLIERMRKLKSEYGEDVFHYVKKLHKNFGHCSSATLAKTLQVAQASLDIIGCAKKYECALCEQHKPPQITPKAAPISAIQFNYKLKIDVLWLTFDHPTNGPTQNSSFPILHMVDAASRFSAAWVLEKEDAECVIKAIQRAWIRPYGPPKIIQCDEQRAFCSGQFQQFCNQNNIEPWIAPGEAHWKLGVVERRHPVLRKAIEL